jgi:hypothetical protein
LETLDTGPINERLERAKEAGGSGEEAGYREALRRWCIASVKAIQETRMSVAWEPPTHVL